MMFLIPRRDLVVSEELIEKAEEEESGLLRTRRDNPMQEWYTAARVVS